LKDGDPLQHAAKGDCDEGDEKLGLCGVSAPSPAVEELNDEETKVNEQLTAHEVRSRPNRCGFQSEFRSESLSPPITAAPEMAAINY